MTNCELCGRTIDEDGHVCDGSRVILEPESCPDPGPELCSWVATEIMEWHQDKNFFSVRGVGPLCWYDSIGDYTKFSVSEVGDFGCNTDFEPDNNRNHTALMEDRLEEMGHFDFYAFKLYQLVANDKDELGLRESLYTSNPRTLVRPMKPLIRASAYDRVKGCVGGDEEMKCPDCGSNDTEMEMEGIFTTLVGYGRFEDELGEHHHDDNCLKRRYVCCDCSAKWTESIVRRCNLSGCGWEGKLECACLKSPKVTKWTDPVSEKGAGYYSDGWRWKTGAGETL